MRSLLSPSFGGVDVVIITLVDDVPLVICSGDISLILAVFVVE